MKIQVKFRFLFLIFLLMPVLVSAQQKYYYTTLGGALGGYDVVEYYNLSQGAKAVKGKSAYATKYQDLTWYFKSQENLDKFKANPQNYVPKYGGYCAYAIAAKNKLVGPDANAWDIVDGKLYLNYSQKTQATWHKDTKGYIAKGNANWKKKGYTNP